MVWVQHRTPHPTLADRRLVAAAGSLLVQLALVPFPTGSPKSAGRHGKPDPAEWFGPAAPLPAAPPRCPPPASHSPGRFVIFVCLSRSGPYRLPRGLWCNFEVLERPRHVLYNAIPDPSTGELVIGDRATQWSATPLTPLAALTALTSRTASHRL